jgi:hypothetical protein
LNAVDLNLVLFINRKVELIIRERAAHSHSPQKVSLAIRVSVGTKKLSKLQINLSLSLNELKI